MTAVAAFGIGSAILSLVNGVPYVRDVLRGATRPHRGTWLIWSALGATAFASQFADGAGWSLAMVGVQTVSTLPVFLLSLAFGVGGIGRVELCLLGGAGLGLVGWVFLRDPAVATSCVVVADAAGVALMLPKTWRDPRSETCSTYSLAAAAGVLSVVAVGTLDLSLLIYPVYFAVVNGATAALIVWRRRAITARSQRRPGCCSRPSRVPATATPS